MMTGTTLLLAAAVALAAAVHPARPPDDSAALRRAADHILRHQAPDGALTLLPASRPENTVIPYFSNFAAIGMADACRLTRDSRYLEGVRRWVTWYEQHLNPDNTIYDYGGSSGAWKSTGKYDSTDSYASTYMEMVMAAHRARPDRAWLEARVPYLRKTLAAIRLTLQPNGLTKAHPTWDFMYTMDNVEVAKGLRALGAAARTAGDRELAAEADGLAAATVTAIGRDLWDPVRECYRIGVMSNGAAAEGLEKWYPDIMANLMAVGWLPPSERNRALYGRLKAKLGAGIPASVATEADLDRAVWWAWAAIGAGDRALASRLTAAMARFTTGDRTFANVAYPGHICRIIAAQWQARPAAQGGRPGPRRGAASSRSGPRARPAPNRP